MTAASELGRLFAGPGLTRGLVVPGLQGGAWVLFLALWFMISRSDFRDQRIQHRHLLIGAWAALAGYSILLVSSVLGSRGYLSIFYRWAFYGDLTSHAVLSAAAALALWWARIWPAGDAKLFALLALIYPFLPSAFSFDTGWIVLYSLINIFLPAAVAVFILSARHIWSTRLKHQPRFLLQLAGAGWGVASDYALGRLRAAGAAVRDWTRSGVRYVRDNPWECVKAVAQWLASMVLMSLICTVTNKYWASTVVNTLFGFAVMLLLQGTREWLGPWGMRGLWALMGGGIALGFFPFDSGNFLRSFGLLMVFSFFLSMGIRATMSAMTGQIVMLGLMLAMPLAGVLGGYLLRGVAWIWGIPPGAWIVPAALRGAIPLALLGTFFGLSFVLVRIWDAEDHPIIPRERLLSFMLLHRSFLERLRADEDFFNEHFATVYPDGMTVSQAEALKAWCARENVDSVPLAGTIPFAHWIFLGYFLTWALGGHVMAWIL